MRTQDAHEYGLLESETVRARWAVIFLMVAAILWVAAGALLFERALRVERKITRRDAGQEVSVAAADGAILRGQFVKASSSSDCVMILHGVADSHASALGFAPMFLEAGYSVLAPDSRAHGASGGELVTFGVLEADDVVRWAEWLRNRGCRRLYGLGESLGAAILIQAAAKEQVFAAVVAECAFRDLPSIATYRVAKSAHVPEFVAKALVVGAVVYGRGRYGLDLTEASPVESAKRLRTPLLLIHGTKDDNTPPAHSQAIADGGTRSELWLVPAAGHTNASAVQPVEFRKRVLEWFERVRESRQ
jgi:dipeptidyl aminopeptidase/acylaminoacyl peptidase